MDRKSLLAAIFLAATISGANAAPIVTKYVEFSISGNGPVSPVIGSFTISLDPAQTYNDASAGFAMNSFNLTINSPVVFDYFKNSDLLLIGGSEISNAQIVNGSFDFYFAIDHFLTAPSFGGMAYVQGGPRALFVFNEGAVVNRLSVTDVQDVPEPVTISLFGIGVAGALTMRRRKQNHAT